MSLFSDVYLFNAVNSELMRRFSSITKTASLETVKLAEQRVPLIVDNLIARGLFSPEVKTALARTLKDHSKCLLLLDEVASKVPPGELGSPVRRSKQAATDGGHPYERESTRVFTQSVLANAGKFRNQ